MKSVVELSPLELQWTVLLDRAREVRAVVHAGEAVGATTLEWCIVAARDDARVCLEEIRFAEDVLRYATRRPFGEK